MARKATGAPAPEMDSLMEPQTEAGSTPPPPGAEIATGDTQPMIVAAPPEPRPDVKVKRYRVMNSYGGGVNIMFGGYKTFLRYGKELDENTYDLDSLVKQGVQLQEI